MKLKKTAAFIIALSMLIGLLSVFPASALTPVTGYAEEILIDESFDSASYDKALLNIENGNIADGNVNFELSGKSGLALNASMNLAKTKQYIIDFELATDVSYTDPWTATFIGTRNVQAGAAPWDAVNGTWLGITKDKLILWHSYEDSKWAQNSAKEGFHYTLIDNTFDVSDAAYRVIYEGSVAEIYIDQAKDGNYVLMATVTVADSKGSIKAGETTLLSARTFTENQASRYFSLWNYKEESEEYDPLKPVTGEGKSEGEGEDGGEISLEETKVIKLGSFKVIYYADRIMTDDQRVILEEKKTEIEDVIAKYGTDERVYYDSSVDTNALSALVEQIDELLSRGQVLAAEYDELMTSISAAMSMLIDQAAVDSYIARFKGFESTLTIMEGDPKYSESSIENIRAAIASAKEIVNADVLTPAMMDAEFNKVASMFTALGVCTEDGIPAVSLPFTDTSYDYAKFSADWYTRFWGNDSAIAVSGENGALIKMTFDFNSMRAMMQYKQKYTNYSVQATVTKISGGFMTMGVRQNYTADTFEQDNTEPKLIGGLGTGVAFISTGSASDFNTVYIGLKHVNDRSDANAPKSTYAIDMTKIPGALSNNNKTATFLIKDMDDVIEFYTVTNAGTADEEKVKLGAIYFNLEKSGSQYTKGILVNSITGEEKPFSGIEIASPAETVHGFSGRSAILGIKDYKLCTNLAPSGERMTSDGKSDPKSVKFETEDGSLSFTKDEVKKFSVNADFDRLKIYGKNEFLSGSIDVRGASTTNISTSLGDKIVAIDPVAGTITANGRGSELVTVKYKGVNNDFVVSNILTVDSAYTAPAEDNIFDKRIVSAVIANAAAFKSVDEGVSVIPVIDYTLPNGTTEILPEEYYVDYKSSDEDVIAYDSAMGKFVAKKPGTARVWAEISYKAGTAADKVVTPEISVEVTEAGTMTPGTSVAGAINDLYYKAKDSLVTPGEYKKLVDAAIEAGIKTSYGATDDEKLINAMLIRNEIAEFKDVPTEEEVIDIVATALKVRTVYDVVADENSNANDLKDILFSGGSENSLGISLKKYNDLTSVQATRAITRVYNQLVKEDAEKLTLSKITDIMDTVIKSVAGGGGSGKGGVTNETNKKTGGGGTGGGAIIIKPETSATKKPLLTGDAAKAQAEKFSDINDAAWAKEAIGALAYEGVVSGYEDGTIRPNAEITRDEFVKLLVCALSVEVKDGTAAPYSDIAADSWQAPFVAAATEAGIVSGTGTLTFGSGETITRQDMATMIYRAVLKLKVTLPNDKLTAFKDAEMIAGYATEAVNKLAAAGVISGMGDDTFAPGACATRAQAISMIFAIRSLMK